MLNNRYRQASYETSAHTLAQLMPDSGREVAFAGRSNSGKSSVINALTGQKRLAKISKTPGRTQLINFFPVNEEIRLVDLPGYGYAKVPEKVQAHWAETLGEYFQTRRCLAGVVLITDIRRGLTEFDEQMLSWCESAGLAVHILLNKSDKLAFGASRKALQRAQNQFGSSAHSVQLFSVLKKTGVDELVQALDAWMLDEKKKAPA
ncbi:MAG: YihA family ribosome biogenesis GTP-binding protein [Gammaproteobacteria bacterium]|nr:YihA family ribosome biogenesis GTP-binding protein [Gammaproteobacteria bacterium]